MFDELAIHEELGIKRIKKTKTGFSTDASVLEQLSAHPLPAAVLEHRQLTKLKGTYVDALPALVLMTSIYTGSLTGGGILAILINTPGTPGAVATTFDGYTMTKKGLHNEALGLQIAASVIGGLLSYLALLVFIHPMTTLALEFGPSEMLFLTLFVLVVISAVQGKHPERSLFAGLLGLMLSTLGTSNSSGLERGTFGFDELADGLPLILSIIGMFAIPEMITIITAPYLSGRSWVRAAKTASPVILCSMKPSRCWADGRDTALTFKGQRTSMPRSLSQFADLIGKMKSRR